VYKLMLLTFLLVASSAFGNAAQKGYKIANEMQLKNDGYKGEDTDMEMILIDAHGARTTRRMLGKSMEVDSDGDRSLINFVKPADVKGTKMLTWTHQKKDNDQWLYMPSLKRVKRISSSNKSASFMGSEFSFEDLGSQEVDKYNFKWIRDEKDAKNGHLHVLERTPKDKGSGYSKMVVWMAKNYNGPVKMEYYDRRGELLKVANFTDYKSHGVDGVAFWRPNRIEMKNIQTQKQSIMTWKARKLGVKFKKRAFDKRSLK